MTGMRSETRPGPGGHSRKVADGESEDTRARRGGPKGKPCRCMGYHAFWFRCTNSFSLLFTFATTTCPRLEIRLHDQSTLGKDTRHGRAGSACDHGPWSVPPSHPLLRYRRSLVAEFINLIFYSSATDNGGDRRARRRV